MLHGLHQAHLRVREGLHIAAEALLPLLLREVTRPEAHLPVHGIIALQVVTPVQVQVVVIHPVVAHHVQVAVHTPEEVAVAVDLPVEVADHPDQVEDNEVDTVF